MRLWAISDLHLGYEDNRKALQLSGDYKDDWLILGGDIGETTDHLKVAFDFFGPRFKKLVWIPGNHELWATPDSSDQTKGEARYLRFVEFCRENQVLTPEDPYPEVEFAGEKFILAPMFLLYDYSFRPQDVGEKQAVAWAAEENIVCTDEYLISPKPYASLPDWCRARCDLTEKRLMALPGETKKILVNHFPTREIFTHFLRIPRFAIWCGTNRTDDWHTRFNAEVVVYGHLHIRTTRKFDGVRFEEVSLGYPRQWDQSKGFESYLRQIFPAKPNQAYTTGF